MHSCQCLHHLRPLSPALLAPGRAGTVIKRLYASENPKWTSQAEEQFAELFKLKEKPPREHPAPESQPRPTRKTAPEPAIPVTPPPPAPEIPVRKSSIVLPPLPPLPPLPGETSSPRRAPAVVVREHLLRSPEEPRVPAHRFNAPPARRFNAPEPVNRYNTRETRASRPLTSSGEHEDPLPQIASVGENYSYAIRNFDTTSRPKDPFEKLEAQEREPKLSEESGSVLKLWIEGLPTTDKTLVADGLQLLAEHPIVVSDLEVVTERGMIATKSAFFTVDFGENNREKIFYQLENFGLTIKGMRCPVRTAETKRSLTLIELGQISEKTLTEVLEQYDIPYATYDYPNRYNSPQRQIAFPYRGSVILTFRSHKEALDTKRRFDSIEGIRVGEKRIMALWGPRAGAQPLETRTAANYMRNLIWENRDLRKYVKMVRTENAQLKEPEVSELSDLTRNLEAQQLKELDRQRKLEEIRLQLAETRRVLDEARQNSNGEETEAIKKAEQAIETAKEFEAELQTEDVVDSLQSKSVLYEIGTTRTISPFISKIENTEGFHKVTETFDTKYAAMKQKHNEELKELRRKFDTTRKAFTREVFAKNHRHVQQTAEELGVNKMLVQRDTKLKSKPAKKRRGARKAATGDSENAENSENSENSENAQSSENSENAENTEGTAEVTEGEGEGGKESGEAEVSAGNEGAENEEVIGKSEEKQSLEETEREENDGEEETGGQTASRSEGETETEETKEAETETKDTKTETEDTKTEIEETEATEETKTDKTNKTKTTDEKQEDSGDTTIIVDAKGNKRVAKIVDWKP